MIQIIPFEHYYWRVSTKFIDGETNDFVFELCVSAQAIYN